MPFQTGQIQAYDQSLNLKANDPANRLNPGINSTWLPILSTSNLNPALNPQTGSCHFGVTVPNGLVGYDLSILGVDSYLDWWHNSKPSTVADNIQYYKVLQVGDLNYSVNLAALPRLVSDNPGAVWIIGNEPDAEVTFQDHISAETYAERFYAMATYIRAHDTSAKIGFGSVIQPTPVRLYYLDKAITRLTQLAGTRADALALIDIYTIHAFILNEQPMYDSGGNVISWGAGVPVGYNKSSWPAYQVIDGTQTYDINLFKSRVTAFRQWMQSYGEQSKPLWITEYGSLLPTWLNVSELTSATFMEQTFDFMLGTKDTVLGDINDDYRLVQKWLWYSLNDDVDHFGGSLYNPLTHQLTTVGDHFINYNPSTAAVPITDPDVYIDASSFWVASGSSGQYQISVKVANNVSSDRLTAVKVDLYLGANLVGTVNTNLPRCAGKIPVSFVVNNLQAGHSYTFTARVTATNGTDISPANNEVVFPSKIIPYFTMIPNIFR